jgi:hypothetical protein
MGPLSNSEGCIEKNLKFNHLVAPFTSYPNMGTNINKIKKKRANVLSIFLRLFLGMIVKRNKIIKEIIK